MTSERTPPNADLTPHTGSATDVAPLGRSRSKPPHEQTAEEDRDLADWAKLASQPNVVVVPFFISDGLHSYQDIPVLLGIEQEVGAAASQRSVFRNNPYRLRGKTLYFASAIGTEPLFADVILDQVEAFDEQHAPANA